MTPEEMQRRTTAFSRSIVMLCRELPSSREGRLIGDQVFRSGTSVGANYRAACRARSRAAFVAEMDIVLEEADETAFWPELLEECGVVSRERLMALRREASELVAIFVASLKTARPDER
jgi:four helix bundle protein